MDTLLQNINSPQDVKKLSVSQLPQLAEELREYILQVVSVNGGHLGAALGVTDLTVALHYFFDSPKDVFVWDVGHQVHAHKIITGRKEFFKTFRQPGAMSGFSNKDESDHDLFTTGHAGTSISTALGIAAARRVLKDNHKAIAIIGDASIVSGMAFEAINHAGHLKDNLIVILNDNEMSISPTVGAFNRYLNKVITSPAYNHLRDEVGELLKKIPKVGTRVAQKAKKFDEGIRNLLVPNMLFEELGFRYFGPIDGHNIDNLVKIFKNISQIPGPILLHIVTQKGKGYKIAECDPSKWHASTPFCVETGEVKKSTPVKSYTQVFGQTAVKLAEENSKVVAITAAMGDGTGLVDFSKKFPDRFFDVGIAEEHGVAFAAGLAEAGLRPLTAIYSTFLQRAHDQIIHDVALQNLPVIFCLDRGGLVGEDGPTHHGVFDMSYLRKVPGMVLMAPRDGRELELMMRFAVGYTDSPIAMRYPRGAIAEESTCQLKNVTPSPIVKGKAELLKSGNQVLILGIGSMAYTAYEAAILLENEGISAAAINPRFVKPLDEDLIVKLSQQVSLVITLEEGTIIGGFGSAILELFERHGIQTKIKTIGIPDKFIEHGKRDVLLDNLGLSAIKVKECALSLLQTEPRH